MVRSTRKKSSVVFKPVGLSLAGSIGQAAKAAVSQLLEVLNGNKEVGQVRRGAAKTLRQLGKEIPTPIAQLQGKTKSIRLEWIHTKVENLGKGVDLEMVTIPGGTFLMGSPYTEAERDKQEGPQHSVTIAPFYMGKYPVTQAQWRAVAGLPKVERNLDPDPSEFKGADRPVERVSWYDAVEFCARLSRKTRREYRLPSEAEWEYACRAGTKTPFHFGETMAPDLANYDGNYTYGCGFQGLYRKQTTPVGSFQAANSFGLYDMHGNVWEWCADPWHDNYKGAPADGSAWLSENNSQLRLLRGGSWVNLPWHCRSACRNSIEPDYRGQFLGFRVAYSAG